MKKQMKKTLSMILTLAMILTMTNGYHSKDVKAAVKTQCTTYEGSNVGAQNYSRWSNPMKSYLVAEDDGSFMRVQYGNKINGLLVEYYDKDYNLEKTKIVDEELPYFGGFYATEENYYVVTGQENTEEDEDKEVYRITKYDKQWNKIKSTGLKACNTVYPFDAGSCRMEVSGKYMLIRTCHEMYKTSDGYNHQANVTIQLDIEDMKITDSYTGIMNESYGYVSHSFNQFIKTEDDHIISLDHGDAHPRSFVLMKYKTDFTTGTFTPTWGSLCTRIPVLEFKGESGNNTTGASVGGFEISDDHYLVAANSVVQDDNFASHKTRNVFIAAVDKSTSEVKTTYLTNYQEGEETTTTPQLVKISGTRFMVLWTKGDQVYYTLVNNNGEKVGEIHNFKGNLSDCQSVISGDKVVWYTWKNGDVVFYDINTTNLSEHNTTEIHNGHQYVYDPSADTDDTITFKCKECGATKTEKKITLTGLYWRSSEATNGNYYSMGSRWNQKVGTTMESYIWYTPSDSEANKELDITSSNEDVIAVEKASGIDVNLIAKKAGTSTITIKPKYNPKNVYTYTITAYDPLKITNFEATNKTPQLDEKVTLSAKTQDGAGTLQYKFYEEDSEGNQTIIRNYNTSATCNWTPSTLGKKTLYVEVKDAAGNIEKKQLTDVTVTKKQAPKITDLQQSYCYTIGAKDQKIDFNKYLPEDIKNATYEAKITNPSSREILTEASKDATTYSYNVSKDGQIGDQASIQFTIKSDNYEDFTFHVNVTLTDKLKVTPQAGNEPAIEGSNELTYGQKISTLKLNTSKAAFIAEDGSKVTGTLKFDEPDKIPEVGTKTASYTFTPDTEQYKTYTGTVEIIVKKAKLAADQATVDATTLATSKYLKDLHINTGKVTAIYNGEEKEISGTWSFESPNEKLAIGKNSKTIVFTPDDTKNYETISQQVDVVVHIKLQASKTKAAYKDTIELTIDKTTLDTEATGDTYHFYYVNEKGNKVTIQAAANEPTCEWQPVEVGTYTVYVSVNGKNCTAKVENIEITKAEAPEISDISKEYPYTTGSEIEKINLKNLLPEDIKLISCRAEIQDDDHIIDQSEFSNNNEIYNYHINKNGKIDDTATIKLTVNSENYKDITITINIKLRDQFEIEPNKAFDSSILSKEALTYGDKVSDLGLKSKDISLETKNGETISGTVKFKDSDQIPEVGTPSIDYIFTPNDKKYKDYEGSIQIKVEKQTPTLSVRNIQKRKYDPQKTIKDISFEKEATVMIAGEKQEVSGTWQIKNKDEKLPLGKCNLKLEFIPEDKEHYTSVTKTMEAETFIELSTDAKNNEAKVGDTIHLSADPKAEDLQYKFYVEAANGTTETIRDYEADSDFAWIPDSEGKYTIYVEAKDQDDNTAIAQTEKITINKKEVTPSSPSEGSTEQKPTTAKPNKPAPKPTPSIKRNMTATVNGITYKVTKVVNTKNAEVSIKSVDKKKSSVTIPDYVTIKGAKCKVISTEKKAFYKKTKLKTLTIGKNIQTIADDTFNGCKNLKSITIKSTVLKKVGKNAIKGIYKKATIKVPKKQYSKYKKLFGSKSGFKKTMKLKK